MKAADLIRITDLPKDSVHKYIQGKVDQPRGNAMERLADAIGVNELWLRDGIGPELSGYPLVGVVSAGETFIPVDDSEQGAGLNMISLDIDAVDPIAIEVQGTSMIPAYRPGDMLFCSRQMGADIQSCLYKDCVVMTESGEGYLKVLTRGSKDGLFTLESYNRAFEPIEDVRLQWVAPVRIIKR